MEFVSNWDSEKVKPWINIEPQFLITNFTATAIATESKNNSTICPPGCRNGKCYNPVKNDYYLFTS